MRVIIVELTPSRSIGLGPSLVDQDVASVKGMDAAIEMLRTSEPEVIVLDVGTESGPHLVPTPAEAYQRLADAACSARIIVVGAGDELLVQEMLRQGAFDFLTFPDELDALAYAVRRATRVAQLERRTTSTGGRRRLAEVVPGLMSGDPTMRRVARRCERLVGHPTRVLLQGEPGTGRKTLARMLSQTRRGHASQAAAASGGLGSDILGGGLGLLPPILSCSASTRISDINDLFDKVRSTTPVMSGPSTLGPLVILDSIDELSPDTQAALLRRLVEAETIWRDRTALPRTISVATENLGSRIAEGFFRRDLYDRLAEVHLCLPSLRNRSDDCVELADWFLQKFQQSLGRHRLRLSDEAIDAIRDHDWPGNVAELSNAVKQAVITAEGPSIRASDLGLTSSNTTRLVSLRQAREDAERDVVQRALKRVNGNIARASEMLGISRPTLYDLLNKLGMR
ncbi:MAG: sigma 54-interacting transcriptional regulator [Lautropia sp.]|nr:sigma 54-interacting transcriptional regulator [Lautropia sp.]